MQLVKRFGYSLKWLWQRCVQTYQAIHALQAHVSDSCHWLRQALVMNQQLLEKVQAEQNFDPIRETGEFKALLAEFETRA